MQDFKCKQHSSLSLFFVDQLLPPSRQSLQLGMMQPAKRFSPLEPAVVQPSPTPNSPSAEHELVRRFSVRQEGAAAKEQLFVAAPTERSKGALQVLRPARRLVVAEDIDSVNERLVESVHDAAPALQFYPHACAPQRANAVLQEQVGWSSVVLRGRGLQVDVSLLGM